MMNDKADYDDIETMKDVRAKAAHDDMILAECYAMVDPENKWARIATREHVAILIKEIESLKTQIKLGVVHSDIQEI